MSGSERATPARRLVLRRFLGACLFAAAGGLLVASYYATDLQPCDDIVARVGQVPLIHSCRPLRWDDGPVVFLAISALLCFAPDIARFEVFGLLSVERKVAMVEQETKALRADLLHFRQNIRVTQLQLPAEVDLSKFVESLDSKAAIYEATDTESAEPAEAGSTEATRLAGGENRS